MKKSLLLIFFVLLPAIVFAAGDPINLGYVKKVETFLDNIMNNSTTPLNTGHYEEQLLYYIKVLPIVTCDTDGSSCGQLIMSTAQSALDGTNALHYRSDSRIRFYLSDAADYNITLEWDIYNNWCTLADGLSLATVNILDGYGNYTYATSIADSNGVIHSQDYNNDGNIDENDNNSLCVPVDMGPLNNYSKLIQDVYGAVAVFLKNGLRKVKWDDVNNLWIVYRASGGDSGCNEYYINLPVSLNSDNLFSHESGHYLCLPHPHWGIDLDNNLSFQQQIIDRIKDYVHDGYAQPWETEKIINDLFDKDDEVTFGGIASYLNLPWLAITDTPADVSSSLFGEVFGSDHACDQINDRVSFSIEFSGYTSPFTYEIKPDRQNIMSYFKTCFPDDAHFSKIQVAVAEMASLNHRLPVTDVKLMKTWRNSEDVPIPVYDAAKGTKWATSFIEVDDRNDTRPASRAIIGVDIKHPRGGLDIYLVTPDSKTYVLQQAKSNAYQIQGNVKTLFYFNDAYTLQKNGIWKLLVAENRKLNFLKNNKVRNFIKLLKFNNKEDKPHKELKKGIADIPVTIDFSQVAGKIDDWQIQFEYMPGRATAPPGADLP